MAERLSDLSAQIESVRQLGAVVTAMRGIAASRAQKGRSLLPGIEAFADVVSRAIGEALNLLRMDATEGPHPSERKRGVILFCAEQGFAGAFSERVLHAVEHEPAGTVLFLVGTRGALVARERGIAPAWTAPMATSPELVPQLANRLADALYARLTDDGLASVDIVCSRTTTAGAIEVERRSLLPIDFSRFTRPVGQRQPLLNLEPSRLMERLAAEYVFAQLCLSAMQAFEAENEARMLAMASARTNIDSRLALLRQRERQVRQEEITGEIIELATGAEALRNRS
jgi:F-type H+-transporting ATPase subunit gamma